jgi:hypothetical protein
MARGVKPRVAEGDRFLPNRAVSLANRLFHLIGPASKICATKLLYGKNLERHFLEGRTCRIG